MPELEHVIPFIAEIPEDFDKKWPDYINTSKDIQLSIICPTIKGFNFINSMYNTIITKLNIEMVFVSPNEPNEKLPPNCKWIKVAPIIKPVQCWEIGMHNATGETVSLCADDQIFSPYAWDEAYNIYKESNDYKTFVSLHWFEPKYHEVTISGFETDTNKFNDYVSLCRFEGIQLPTPEAIINKKYFMELGGFDRSYVRQECIEDFYRRAILDGVNIKFTLYGRVYEYGHMHPLANKKSHSYIHVYQDFEKTKVKWKFEGGKLIQCVPTESFIFDDTIYTSNQGATFGIWS